MAIKKLISEDNIGTYLDYGNIEAGKVNPVLPAVNSTPVSFVPSPTGNATNRNEFVIDPNGHNWFIDYAGDAVLLASSTTNNTILVDQSYAVQLEIKGDLNAVNTLLQIGELENEGQWSVSGTEIEYDGTPDKVQIFVNLYAQHPQSGLYARITPVVEILRNGVVIGQTAEYQRHATGNDESDNSAAIMDMQPGTDPVYSLRSQQGGTQNDILDIDVGHFSANAISKVEVYAPTNAVPFSNTNITGGAPTPGGSGTTPNLYCA